MDIVVVLLFGVPVAAMVWLTGLLAWRDHRDRRLGARRGYSFGANYNDRHAAEVAAARSSNAVRSLSWPS